MTDGSRVAETTRCRTVRRSAASRVPKAISNSFCVARHFAAAAFSRASPAGVSCRLRVRASSPALIASNLSRSNGRMARPKVVRSMTIDFASSLIESGPSRLSFARIEYCVVAVLRVIIAAGGGWIAVTALGGSNGLFAVLAAALVVYGVANVAAVAGGAWFTTVKKEPLPAAAI